MAPGCGKVADYRHFTIRSRGRGGDRSPDLLEQVRRCARQQPRPHRVRRIAQELIAKVRRQIDPDAGFDGKFGIGFCLRHHNGKAAGGNARAGIADDLAADRRVATGQQRVGDDLLQPPAARDRQQMLLAPGFRDLDKIVFAQSRRLLQDRSGDGDFVMIGEPADDGRRRLRDRCQLLAHFGKRHAGADVGDRANLDGLDQPFEHVVEQLDLLVVEAVG